jgi:hypothetical protein
MKRINLRKPVVFLILAMLVFTAIIFPAESGTRSNPEVTPLPILSDWYFLALYQLLKYMDPYWATIWTLGIPFVTIGLTFLDWGPERAWQRRPIFTTIGVMAAIEFVVFSLLIIANMANIETDPPYWFAHLILMITIGEFWHWSMYKQRLPMTFWVLFNLVVSGWYLLFWHMVVQNPKLNGAFNGHNLEAWFAATFQGAVVDITFTNVYWSLLWFGFAILQMLIAGFLFWVDRRRRDEREAALQLEGATA